MVKKGEPGIPHTEETRAKIGIGARNTRLAERLECPYGCGMVSNNGAIARHIAREHEFQCLVAHCDATTHKGRGMCAIHHGIDCVMRKYELTVLDYYDLLEQQKYLCLLCDSKIQTPGTGSKRVETVVVDHCHRTGRFRGLICMPCNLALGHIRDNIETLRRMIKHVSGADA